MTAKARLLAWLRLFRVVNLPTVPGDVLAGAAVSIHFARGGCLPNLWWAALASVLVYMFGLADNDIAGAKTDKGRPIPDGEISQGAARVARGFSLGAVLIIGSIADLPPAWWIVAFALVVLIVVYNRTQLAFLMGACRALDVILGAAAVGAAIGWGVSIVAIVWGLYFFFVTKCSEGEEEDAGKKNLVGVLIGSSVYLQLVVLLAFPCKPLLIAGAALLIVHRFVRKLLPEVDAS